MTPKQLASYARVCKKHGIHMLEIDGLKMSIDYSYKATTTATKGGNEVAATEEGATAAPTEEEVMFWSAGSTP